MEATKNEQEKIREQIDVPEEFNKIMKDFLNDILFIHYPDLIFW